MIPVPSDDDFRRALVGRSIPSDNPGYTYRLERVVGEGAMSAAFYAIRASSEGEVPVVVKVLRPGIVRQWGETAHLLIQKEAIALGRLNERVPATPFVVRFIDTGIVNIDPTTADPGLNPGPPTNGPPGRPPLSEVSRQLNPTRLTDPDGHQASSHPTRVSNPGADPSVNTRPTLPSQPPPPMPGAAPPSAVPSVGSGVPTRPAPSLELPFIAVEYVHGGALGTTLSQRVDHALRTTGKAFSAQRAAVLVDALCQGLMAVHEVGVIHRDLKPDNVLCCGFGEEEIFKIADFGVARPAGVAATFGGFVVGTMGYAAPELATHDQKAIGPWSDIFGLAAIIYFALTGEDYFDVHTPADAIVAAVNAHRRSIRDAPGLVPELRNNEQACRAIDYALACATSAKTEVRPGRADALATMLTPWLRSAIPAHRVPAHLRTDDEEETTSLVRWVWSVLRRPGTSEQRIRSVAWDADGRCMAATDGGLRFWNGSTWLDVDHTGLPDPAGMRFVRRSGPGQWLVGGDRATFATYTTEGVSDIRQFKGWDVRFELFDGDLDDLAVLVGASPDGALSLCALSGRRWLKALPIPEVASLRAIRRFADAKWLLTGRDRDGKGYAAIYRPLDWDVERIPSDKLMSPTEAEKVRGYLACDGQHERQIGLATGTDGMVVWVRNDRVSVESVPEGPALSAAAVDPAGRGWAAGAGQIWLHVLAQEPSAGGRSIGRWSRIWHDPNWSSPVVALFTEPGLVIAMTADGGIVEGRATDERIPTVPPPRK